MSLILTITDAGRQALVNAQNTGTLPIVISQIALGSGRYNTTKTQTTLQNEIKRVASFGGAPVADDVIHITVHDESTDTYPLGEFGLITNTGVLFAVYSNPNEYILEKNANGILLLSADTKITTLDITDIQFSGTNFVLPPGTTTIAGVLKLADSDEAAAGIDNSKAMTPKTTKEVLDAHKNAAEAHSWNQISNKPASFPPAAHTHETAQTPPKGNVSARIATTDYVKGEGKQYAMLVGVNGNISLTADDMGKCFIINGGYDIELPSVASIANNGKTLTFSVGYAPDSLIARLVCKGSDVIRDVNPLTDPATALNLYAAERIEIACDASGSWYVTNWISRRPLMLEAAPTSDIVDANLYTRAGHWVTPAAGLVNFPAPVIASNTRAIMVVSGNSIGITQQVTSRNGDGRRFHRTATTFEGLAAAEWIEERNSKNTLNIGTTPGSARAALELGSAATANLVDIVQTTNNQTIAGQKTFTADMYRNAPVGQASIYFQQAGVTNGRIYAQGGPGTDVLVEAGRFVGLNGVSGSYLSHNGSQKLQTSTTGVTVNGDVNATAAVSGSHVISSGAQGFISQSYVPNARNPIWRFGNADGVGLSYFQGSAGYGGNHSIGIHFGTASAPESTVNFTSQSIIIRSDNGTTPNYANSQLVVRSEGENPAAIGFWRDGFTAVQLVHTANNSLDLYNTTYGNRAIFHAGSLELGQTNGVAQQSYIDFHSGAITTDYDARIISTGGNGAAGGGALTFVANSFSFSGGNLAGNGSGLTSLNASNLGSGIVHQDRLPFMPVQQGGGIGQSTNKVHIGWSSSAELKCTVDSTDLGALAFKSWVNANFADNHPTATTTEMQQGTSTALRQLSPALVKSAIDAQVGSKFDGTSRQSITLTLGNGIYAGTFSYWRVGVLVFASFEIGMNQSGNSVVKIANIPSNATPWSSSFTPFYQNGSASAMLEARATGELFIHMNAISSVTATGHAIWRAI